MPRTDNADLANSEVSAEDWVRELIEHVLMLGATAVSNRVDREGTRDSLEVMLTFRVEPVESKNLIEISVLLSPDRRLMTYISRPF